MKLRFYQCEIQVQFSCDWTDDDEAATSYTEDLKNKIAEIVNDPQIEITIQPHRYSCGVSFTSVYENKIDFLNRVSEIVQKLEEIEFKED